MLPYSLRGEGSGASAQEGGGEILGETKWLRSQHAFVGDNKELRALGALGPNQGLERKEERQVLVLKQSVPPARQVAFSCSRPAWARARVPVGGLDWL